MKWRPIRADLARPPPEQAVAVSLPATLASRLTPGVGFGGRGKHAFGPGEMELRTKFEPDDSHHAHRRRLWDVPYDPTNKTTPARKVPAGVVAFTLAVG